MVLVVAAAIAAYLAGQTAWREGGAQIALQRRGSITMEKMVRGVDGRNGIREAKAVSTSGGGDTIAFISGIDDEERSFFLQGDEIFYDPDTSNPGDEISIADDVNDIDFEMVSTKRAKIEMTLRRRVRDRWLSVNIITNCTRRNWR